MPGQFRRRAADAQHRRARPPPRHRCRDGQRRASQGIARRRRACSPSSRPPGGPPGRRACARGRDGTGRRSRTGRADAAEIIDHHALRRAGRLSTSPPVRRRGGPRRRDAACPRDLGAAGRGGHGAGGGAPGWRAALGVPGPAAGAGLTSMTGSPSSKRNAAWPSGNTRRLPCRSSRATASSPHSTTAPQTCSAASSPPARRFRRLRGPSGAGGAVFPPRACPGPYRLLVQGPLLALFFRARAPRPPHLRHPAASAPCSAPQRRATPHRGQVRLVASYRSERCMPRQGRPFARGRGRAQPLRPSAGNLARRDVHRPGRGERATSTATVCSPGLMSDRDVAAARAYLPGARGDPDGTQLVRGFRHPAGRAPASANTLGRSTGWPCTRCCWTVLGQVLGDHPEAQRLGGHPRIGSGECPGCTGTATAIPPLPEPHNPLVVLNTMWPLDEFTDENGATRHVPGSHRWQPGRQPGPGDPVLDRHHAARFGHVLRPGASSARRRATDEALL